MRKLGGKGKKTYRGYIDDTVAECAILDGCQDIIQLVCTLTIGGDYLVSIVSLQTA